MQRLSSLQRDGAGCPPWSQPHCCMQNVLPLESIPPSGTLYEGKNKKHCGSPDFVSNASPASAGAQWQLHLEKVAPAWSSCLGQQPPRWLQVNCGLLKLQGSITVLRGKETSLLGIAPWSLSFDPITSQRS